MYNDQFELEKSCLRATISSSKGTKIYMMPLRQVTPEGLAHIRESGEPGFVLKYEQKLFYTTILPFKGHRVILQGGFACRHQCPTCGRLSALPDNQGGCAKVRSFSKNIEAYEWITLGYETFNCEYTDVFIVLHCKHHMKPTYPQKHTLTSADKKALRNLYEFLSDYNGDNIREYLIQNHM